MGVGKEMMTTEAEGWNKAVQRKAVQQMVVQEACRRFQFLGRQSSFEVSFGGSRGEGGGETVGWCPVGRGEGDGREGGMAELGGKAPRHTQPSIGLLR